MTARDTNQRWNSTALRNSVHQPVANKVCAACSPHFWYLAYARAASWRISSAVWCAIQPSSAAFSVYASGAIRPVVHRRGAAPASLR